MKTIICTAVILISGLAAQSQPKPNEIFKEFVFIPEAPDPENAYKDYPKRYPKVFYESDPESPRVNNPVRVPKFIDIDLDQAVRAELSVEYWGGHIGTSGQEVSINNNDWLPLPQTQNTPGEPYCYQRTIMGNMAIPIPLDQLQNGGNSIRFTADKQICHSIDWGMYWIYSFTVRVYYNDSKPHIKGKINSHKAGDLIGKDEIFTVDIDDGDISWVTQIDFIGNYTDFNWSGSGNWTEWQYQTRWGHILHHMGTKLAAPFDLKWANGNIPDQEQSIKIMAKITSRNGVSYMTPVVEDLKFDRGTYSVKMYTAYDIPEKFSSRIGRLNSCKIDVDKHLSNTDKATLVLSTWSAATHDGTISEIRINDKRLSDNFGEFHNYDINRLNVPLDMLKEGENIISIYSEYKGHALEVNWPGPALLLYSNKE